MRAAMPKSAILTTAPGPARDNRMFSGSRIRGGQNMPLNLDVAVDDAALVAVLQAGQNLAHGHTAGQARWARAHLASCSL